MPTIATRAGRPVPQRRLDAEGRNEECWNCGPLPPSPPPGALITDRLCAECRQRIALHRWERRAAAAAFHAAVLQIAQGGLTAADLGHAARQGLDPLGASSLDRAGWADFLAFSEDALDFYPPDHPTREIMMAARLACVRVRESRHRALVSAGRSGQHSVKLSTQ